MLTRVVSSKFKKDVERCKSQGKDMLKLSTVMTALINEEPLDRKYVDHPLKGSYKGYRDCHIKPDWVLIYKIENQNITFARTGSHSELFKK